MLTNIITYFFGIAKKIVKKVIIILSVVLLIIIYLFLIRTTKSEKFTCKDCNVILISIDTLRPDHLGCYGYTKNTSPNIDSFCKDSVLFKTAISQAPSTAPSHASILTSLIPSSHGAFFSHKTPISPKVPTAAEILKKDGYDTVSFNGGGQIAANFGFSRGFDLYSSFDERDYVNEYFIDRVRQSTDWLKNNNQNKFFLFLHSYEVHHPYSPKEEFLDETARSYKGKLPKNVRGTLLRDINRKKIIISAEDRKYIESLYDAEIRSVDKGFAQFIGYLKTTNLYNKSLIILTSDHGEEFNEHGDIGWHSHTLFDELLKVPLIIKFPDSAYAGTVIDTQVRSIDILPTILETLELKAEPHFQGATLSTLLQGAKDFDHYAVSQKDSKSIPPSSALRTKEWKLIRLKLYDLINDPKEQTNVASENPEIGASYKDKLETMANSELLKNPDQMEIDQSTQEQLRTLGYVN